jgi:hypothetical protein
MNDASKCPVKLTSPFTLVMSGPSGCGKTALTSELLQSDCIDPRPNNVTYMFAEWQPAYDKMRQVMPEIKFVAGWKPDIYDQLVPENNNLLIIDDLVSQCRQDPTLSALFTRGSHHRNVSIILITQNYFWSGSTATDVRRNTTYLCMFRCKQDSLQMARFGQRIMPYKSKYFMQAYSEATSRPHGYLFVDMHSECPEEFMLRANILGEHMAVYLPD